MVSGCFSGRHGRCDLQVMERDAHSERNGYSARSYIKVLEQIIPQQYDPQMRYLQDNARIHTAHITMQWLTENNVRLFTIPPYSPDMNCIENLWPRLKENMYEIEPNLDQMPKSEATADDMATRILPQAWDLIPQRIIDALVDSMPRRVQAVLDADGWWTHY